MARMPRARRDRRPRTSPAGASCAPGRPASWPPPAASRPPPRPTGCWRRPRTRRAAGDGGPAGGGGPAPVRDRVGAVRAAAAGRRAGVFVPRPETEGLADRAATGCCAAAPRRGRRLRRVGAIACFLAAEVPGARVLATELDPGALAWARDNAERFGVELLAGDLDDPLPAELAGPGRRALRQRALRAHWGHRHPAHRRPRPRAAPGLDGGPDGLGRAPRLAPRTGHWLAPGGAFLCEIGEDQAEAATALLEAAGPPAGRPPDLVWLTAAGPGRTRP